MPGGNPYPALIAQLPRKPLRSFLQAGHRDLGGVLLPDAVRWLSARPRSTGSTIG
jgi:hypothetical protein